MIAEQLINILNDKLKNPIYKTIQLINIKDILNKSNFTKKEGVAVHLVVLHFVYMLVMSKKITTFMKQSDNSFKKDVYYSLKYDNVYPSSYSNIKEAIRGIKEYINTYNTERLHSSLDYLTPDEAYYKGANNKCFDAKNVLLGVA